MRFQYDMLGLSRAIEHSGIYNCNHSDFFHGIRYVARMHCDAERRRNVFYSGLVEHNHRPDNHNRNHPDNCRRV